MNRYRTVSDRKHYIALFFIVVLACLVFVGCGKTKANAVDYENQVNWAYHEVDKNNARADVFFVCPTIYFGDDNTYNMPLDDADSREDFLGAINMEKGIYDKESRFFAPYYRQIGFNVYEMEQDVQERYMRIAYDDVKAAFTYYLENENDGNPIILAGFSQGADLCIRLLKDCFQDQEVNQKLVACYAIGWRITEQEIEENPHLRFATEENDTGVIIAFNSEAESIHDSLMIPNGTKTLAINPLNWKTDGTVADRFENSGACFTDYSGNITNEINNLTGAYIDSTRGALKVTDVSPDDYPPGLDLFEKGIYHLYDYQFFYRNLQENVNVRLDAYCEKNL